MIRDFPTLDTFLPHRDWLVEFCRKHGLTAGGDAEDLVQQVFERIQRRSPAEPVADPRSYLARSARNLAISEWRKSSRRPEFTTLPDDLPLPREEDRHETARETWRQVEKAMPFLTPRQQQVFDASLKVADGELTRQQAATALGITPAAFASELRRLRDYVEAGLLVVLLIEQSDCRALARIIQGAPPSHQLGRAVHSHIEACRACQGRKPVIQGYVHKALYVVPVGLFGIASWLTAKKIAVGSVAAAFTGCAIVGSLLYFNDAAPQAAKPNTAQPVITSSAVVPVADSPSVVQPPTGTLSSQPLPVAPARVSVTSASTKPTPVTQSPQARTDAAPVITAGPDAIEHRRIATPCGPRNGHTKSRVKVGVSAPGGVDSVRLRTTARGITMVIRMIGIGDSWYSQVGPYPDQFAGAVAAVSVEALGTNGQRAQQNLGQIQIADCRR